MNDDSNGRAPRGRGELVLYLDFDGVLHHENALIHPKRGVYLSAPERYRLFQHVGLLEELLAPYPAVRIVLSTSWVLRYGCTGAAKRLPDSLRARVIGATYHKRHMYAPHFRETLRGWQVWQDVQRRQPRGWLALDDNDEGWPREHKHRHVLTHMYEGISEPSVRTEIEQKLKELCK